MHQPIYFPYETVNQTDSNGRFNFSVRGVHDSRTGAYGDWPKNAVEQGTDLPNAGVQVSFSGSLMENMDGLYGTGWRSHYRWGRNGLRTARNNPRLDLVGIAYHHSLMPLTTKEAMRMQVRLHKEAYRDVWNTGGSYSKGFWPPECAFDVNMIPALVDEGIDWVIVDNGHFDRACQGYPWAPASSIRPNKADQLNPDPATLGSQWVQLNNVWAPTRVSAPWGYQPRYVQYVDPWSNPTNANVKRMIAVPAGRYEGNENARGGYGAFKPENVWSQHIGVNNNPQRPMLILCHSDGDNFGMLNADAYNGQHGNFLSMVRANANFEHTSVQDYLELYPVPTNDIIHVEPGSWVGIDGGTPFYDKWRENNARDGEHPDLWSWSVLIAAANRVIHADNLENNYSMNDVRWGIGSDTARAWRFYLQAETSCHWYWDFDRANPWDGNATHGANLAIAEANKVINRHPGTDRVGPTIWPPQRDIWNPGGLHFNESTNQPSNFNVFTFVDDVSGLQNVKLYWRTDNDGENPILEYHNEVYAHSPDKNSAWNVVDMTGDWYPSVRGPRVPNPANRAMRYLAPIHGQNNVLIDYFVEAVDTRGNTNRSDIDQVWVGAANTGGGGGGGGGGGSTGPVTITPTVPIAGQSLTIAYDPAGRGLASATSVNIHHGFNGANWTAVPGVAMTKDGAVWKFTYTVATNATTIAMVFNNGSGTWDNNNNANWNFSVIAQPPSQPPAVPTGLTASGNSPSSVSLSWSPSATASGYVVFRDNVQVATPTGTSYLDTSLQPDSTYSYSIAATNLAGTSSPCFPVPAATLFTPVSNNALRLVTPGGVTTVNTNRHFFRGHAGLGLTNGLRWSNTVSGQTGAVSFHGFTNSSGWAWSAELPLTNGANSFVFSALYPTNAPPLQTGRDSPTNYTGWPHGASNGTGFGGWTITTTNGPAGTFLAETNSVATIGSDSAANYGTSWTNGSGGGSGFANWSFDTNSTGTFLFGNPTNARIGGMGAKAFQLRTPGGNTYATANRALNQPLSVGQTLSFLWGINWDCETTNGAKGFVVFSGTNEIVVVNNANSSNIVCNSVDTGFGYGTNAMRWSFRLNSNNILQVSANDRDGNGTFNTNLTVVGAPSSIRFYAANMETNFNREPYFDDLRIEGPANWNMSLALSNGFGLWANGGGLVTARRNLPNPMEAGDVLTVRLDNNWVDDGKRVGLALANDSGSNRVNFYLMGGQSNYRIDDAVPNRDSGLPYTDNGFLLTFTMTDSNTYSLNLGGTAVTGTLGGSGPITQLVAYNDNAGGGTERNFYVGEMTFTEAQTVEAVTTLSSPTITLQSVVAGIPTSWWDQYGIAEVNRTATADPDGDGWTNAQEFAFGLVPNVAGGKTVSVDPNNPTKIQFLQKSSGATYAVRSASDLSSGFTGTVTATAAADQSDVPEGYTRYEATFPPGSRGFLRVEATLSP